MRLLVLGGTRFLGRHVVTAALERGHDVATFTRGVSGAPPDGVRALHGDRDDPAALPVALDGWAPELVVDTSAQSRAAADNAAAALAGVAGYAFVSSLNAYRDWPPGPVHGEDGPTWDTTERGYGQDKAHAERVVGAALGERFLTARAGLIVGPYDPVYRLGCRRTRLPPTPRELGAGPCSRAARWSTPGTWPAGWSRRPSGGLPARSTPPARPG